MVQQLRGAANEFSRDIPPGAIIQGGVGNGVWTGPMTYLLHILAEQYGELGEEQHLHSLQELMACSRRPGFEIRLTG